MIPRIIGIRHHSPACARLVAHAIAQDRPAAVLIEGPSDFNPRLPELLLPHRLPIALYSYAHDGAGAARCWFPLTGYSPEWVALTQGHTSGAVVRFIDLPHWQYRALPDHERRMAPANQPPGLPGEQRSHYRRVTQALAARLHCDGDHALWDHLFEAQSLASPPDFDALAERLDTYFHDLRGDPTLHTTAQDDAREACMARWVAWAMHRFPGRNVLVVCGGWHKRAIESLWPTLAATEELASPTPSDPLLHGAYLVPYEYRQLEALSGYAAGMQSPQYYQWLAEGGAGAACAQAAQAIVQRLRARQVPASTADVVAFHTTLTALARLRGHAEPLRVDILDAAQSAFVKEALDAPAPWAGHQVLSTQDHPALREALLALTGDARGELAGDTPLPPLVADVRQRLLACGLTLPSAPTTHTLDRRRAQDTLAAQTLWQLRLIGAEGVELTSINAPLSARHLPQALLFEEHWRLHDNPRWLPSLIEAAVHGATLIDAARACLLARLDAPIATAPAASPPSAAAMAQCLTDAVRAGFFDLGEELASRLAHSIHTVHDHGALAQAALTLLDVALAGFWGQDTRPVMLSALSAMGDRLLWLLDGLDAALPTPGHAGAPAPAGSPTLDADVAAVRALAGLLRLSEAQAIAGWQASFTLDSLLRLARAPGRPPALRGAAAGLALTQAHRYAPGTALRGTELIALTRAVPPRDQLGDYLYGLFAITRATLKTTPGLVEAVHATLAQLSHDDFLVALPALRGAFAWFPPRERGDIAARVGALLGLTAPERTRLTQLSQGDNHYLRARAAEAQALAWARDCGLLTSVTDEQLT
ncbi:DUF5682 family protein [Ottowia testudinis]|uniref:Uncharacterized protein n=1 Tax=Ottowia testudinis TaxID=2816950 RepID=A0A975H4Q7_9BURK|nr:DUF5682 family protein [Ottowia testudinis]QTD46620.1 hypothetical protein J1M35_07015 [Ottowia testudinis]